MPAPTYRTNSERWAADAIGKMPGELILLGQRLIDQAEMDARYRDYRLRELIGQNWWGSMIKMASKNPDRTKQLWRHLIERRSMPPWVNRR